MQQDRTELKLAPLMKAAQKIMSLAGEPYKWLFHVSTVDECEMNCKFMSCMLSLTMF